MDFSAGDAPKVANDGLSAGRLVATDLPNARGARRRDGRERPSKVVQAVARRLGALDEGRASGVDVGRPVGDFGLQPLAERRPGGEALERLLVEPADLAICVDLQVATDGLVGEPA